MNTKWCILKSYVYSDYGALLKAKVQWLGCIWEYSEYSELCTRRILMIERNQRSLTNTGDRHYYH